MAETISNEQLQQEIDELKATVGTMKAALSSRYQVTLRTVQPRLFLGQPVTIIASAMDLSGLQPRANIPITFVTTWGRLRAITESTILLGAGITVRTEIDGSARVTLLPPTSEELTDLQQGALETMLSGLNPDAATPADDQAAMQNLAQLYHWEANYQFRDAVDIYFRDFNHKVIDTVNAKDYSVGWSYFDSAVLAYAGDEEQGETLNTFVAGAAALPVRFKDWIGPLFDAYVTSQQSNPDLLSGFQQAKDLYDDAGSLLDGLATHLHDYVGSRRGKIGEAAGRKIAETAMNQYLVTGITQLSDALQAAAAPSLQATTETIAAGGTKLVTAFKQARSDLKTEVGTRIAENVSPITANIDQLKTTVAAKADATAVTSLEASVSTRLTTFVDRASLDTGLATKANATDLTAFRNDITAQIVKKADVTALTAATEDLRKAVNTKADSTELISFREDVNKRLVGKAEITALDTLKQDVNTQIAGKADAAQVTNISRDLESKLASKVDNTTFNQRLAQPRIRDVHQ